MRGRKGGRGIQRQTWGDSERDRERDVIIQAMLLTKLSPLFASEGYGFHHGNFALDLFLLAWYFEALLLSL